MYVAELRQPGSRLVGLEAGSVRDAEALIHLLTGCVADAAIALTLFDNATCVLETAETRMVRWEEDRSREATALRRLQAQHTTEELTGQAAFSVQAVLYDQARLEARRERWAEGHLPDAYAHRLPFLHAKAFVYALDTLGGSLKELARIPEAPQAIGEAVTDFKNSFPDLRGVRNSSHHAEDRVQGKSRGGRIDLKPIANTAIYAPDGGVLVLDMLNGRHFGGTLEDGAYGEVAVGAESLAAATRCVQHVLDAFDWQGPPRHLPE